VTSRWIGQATEFVFGETPSDFFVKVLGLSFHDAMKAITASLPGLFRSGKSAEAVVGLRPQFGPKPYDRRSPAHRSLSLRSNPS
jgi:hypothetical protein